MLNLICTTCNMLLLGILLIGRQLCGLWSKTDGCRLNLQPKVHRDLDYPDLNDVYSRAGTWLRSNTWLGRVASHINRWTWVCGDSMIQGGCLRLKFYGSQQHYAYLGDGLGFVSRSMPLTCAVLLAVMSSYCMLSLVVIQDCQRTTIVVSSQLKSCQHDISSPPYLRSGRSKMGKYSKPGPSAPLSRRIRPVGTCICCTSPCHLYVKHDDRARAGSRSGLRVVICVLRNANGSMCGCQVVKKRGFGELIG